MDPARSPLSHQDKSNPPQKTVIFKKRGILGLQKYLTPPVRHHLQKPSHTPAACEPPLLIGPRAPAPPGPALCLPGWRVQAPPKLLVSTGWSPRWFSTGSPRPLWAAGLCSMQLPPPSTLGTWS